MPNTDQIWRLTIASEAAATGGIFFVVNAATSSMMTYNYEYFWNICCRAAPGPDGIVPVSATKAIIYRGLSIIRVGALALIFGNTLTFGRDCDLRDHFEPHRRLCHQRLCLEPL